MQRIDITTVNNAPWPPIAINLSTVTIIRPNPSLSTHSPPQKQSAQRATTSVCFWHNSNVIWKGHACDGTENVQTFRRQITKILSSSKQLKWLINRFFASVFHAACRACNGIKHTHTSNALRYTGAVSHLSTHSAHTLDILTRGKVKFETWISLACFQALLLWISKVAALGSVQFPAHTLVSGCFSDTITSQDPVSFPFYKKRSILKTTRIPHSVLMSLDTGLAVSDNLPWCQNPLWPQWMSKYLLKIM
jgi:hypothetical protein